MKCVMNNETGIVRRISDNSVKGVWDYYSKSEWKKDNTVPRRHSNKTDIINEEE